MMPGMNVQHDEGVFLVEHAKNGMHKMLVRVQIFKLFNGVPGLYKKGFKVCGPGHIRLNAFRCPGSAPGKSV